MNINIQNIIDRLRNESPLLGRNARNYIADALQGLFNSHISHHGESATAANVVEKVVTNVSPGFGDDQGNLVMRRGTKISVVFQHGNTVANPVLRVGATMARPIIRLSNWPAGTTVQFVLDGDNWRMINAKRTTNITPQMDAAWNDVAVIGTDNGEYANADHVHPANTQHHADHVVAGRLHLDRLPTSEVDNRVLAVVEANTSPSFVQVTDPMIAYDEVRTHHILDRNVTEPKLSDDSVSTRTIIDLNVTEPKLADDSVSTRTIIDRNVTEPKLADDSVSTRTIIDLNVTEPKLADDSVSTRTIIDLNVTEPKLADDSVSTRTIIDQNVTEPKLANDSVSTRTIIDRNVTEPKLADNSVSTRTIIDRNVTEPKLANDAVSTRTILDENVTTPKIADRAVTGSKLFTSDEPNRLLRVGEAGTDPVFDLINMETDLYGTMPVERGGTGADNPEDARHNLQVLSNISPITGGQMRRVVIPVSSSYTVNESVIDFMTIPQLIDRTGHVTGTRYTDGYLVGSRAYAAITHLDWGGTHLSLQLRTTPATWTGSGVPTHLILIQHLPPGA